MVEATLSQNTNSTKPETWEFAGSFQRDLKGGYNPKTGAIAQESVTLERNTATGEVRERSTVIKANEPVQAPTYNEKGQIVTQGNLAYQEQQKQKPVEMKTVYQPIAFGNPADVKFKQREIERTKALQESLKVERITKPEERVVVTQPIVSTENLKQPISPQQDIRATTIRPIIDERTPAQKINIAFGKIGSETGKIAGELGFEVVGRTAQKKYNISEEQFQSLKEETKKQYSEIGKEIFSPKTYYDYVVPSATAGAIFGIPAGAGGIVAGGTIGAISGFGAKVGGTVASIITPEEGFTYRELKQPSAKDILKNFGKTPNIEYVEKTISKEQSIIGGETLGFGLGISQAEKSLSKISKEANDIIKSNVEIKEPFGFVKTENYPEGYSKIVSGEISGKAKITKTLDVFGEPIVVSKKVIPFSEKLVEGSTFRNISQKEIGESPTLFGLATSTRESSLAQRIQIESISPIEPKSSVLISGLKGESIQPFTGVSTELSKIEAIVKERLPERGKTFFEVKGLESNIERKSFSILKENSLMPQSFGDASVNVFETKGYIQQYKNNVEKFFGKGTFEIPSGTISTEKGFIGFKTEKGKFKIVSTNIPESIKTLKEQGFTVFEKKPFKPMKPFNFSEEKKSNKFFEIESKRTSQLVEVQPKTIVKNEEKVIESLYPSFTEKAIQLSEKESVLFFPKVLTPKLDFKSTEKSFSDYTSKGVVTTQFSEIERFKQFEKESESFKPIFKSSDSFKDLSKEKFKPVEDIKFLPKLTDIFKPIEKPIEKPIVVPKQKPVSLEREMVREKEIVPDIEIPKSKLRYKFKEPIFPNRKSFDQSASKELKRFSKGYDVLLKRRGKFSVIGKGLSFERAFGLGSFKADVGLGRTFKLKETGQLVEGGKTGLERSELFYLKKNQPLTFVEKTQYAISTTGEKQELKESRKQNKIFNSLFRVEKRKQKRR